MFVTSPHLLWLLILAPAIAYAGYRTMRPDQRRWSVAMLRTATLAALILAVARPMWRTDDAKPVTIAVVDVSPSAAVESSEQLRTFIERVQADGRDSEIKFIAFSNRSQVVADPANLTDVGALDELRQKLSVPLWPGDPVIGGSAIADALRLAGAQISRDGGGQILLRTDGLATRGDAAIESHRLAQRGIAISVTSQTPAIDGKTLLRSVEIGSGARIGQTINASINIESTDAVQATIDVTDGIAPLARQPVTLKPGTNLISVPLAISRTGMIPLYFSFKRADQPGAAEGQLRAAIQVEDPIRVAVIQENQNQTTLASLKAILGKSADVQYLSAESANDGKALAFADAIVLADLPIERLSAAAQENIRQSVLDGAGLLVTGASRSFGPGGYAGSSLASIIPVRMPQQMVNQDPSTTLVLIVDTSGSMTGPRISLAKEISRLAIRRLQPHDSVGIVEFYGAKRWAAPIQSANNAMELNRALNRLDAAGGTVILPAIEEAGYALRNVNTRTRHILILTDGGVESGPFEQLARKLSNDGITLSTVLCGPGQHSAFLANVAQWGRGRFYMAPDRFSLPEIILRQPQTFVPSPVVQTPTAVEAGPDSLARTFAAVRFESVSEFVPTPAKPTADVVLRTAGGDALLARWRYGAGAVAAFPAQLGSQGTASLGSQSEFASLLSGLFREIARPPHADTPRLTSTLRAAGVEIAIDAPTRSVAENLGIDLMISDTTGATVRTLRAEPIAPGKWNVLVSGLAPGAYRVQASLKDTRSHAAFAVPLPSEFPSLLSDASLLHTIESFAPTAHQNAERLHDSKYIGLLDLQKPLAALALVLMLLTVLARRWPVAQTSRATMARPAMIATVMMVGLLALSARPAVAQTTRPGTGTAWDPAKPIEPQLQNALLTAGDATPLLASLKAAWAKQPELAADVMEVAIEAGDLPLALQAAKQVATARPDDARIAEQLARLYELVGDDKSAEAQLRSAIKIEKDAKTVGVLRLRLAGILMDAQRWADASEAINEGVAADSTGTLSLQAAVLANLYGQYDQAVAYLAKPGQAEPADTPTQLFAKLLEGNARLRTPGAQGASEAFNRAGEAAAHPRDRRYVSERIIAAARQQNALPALADTWLKDPALSPDRLLPLATVLRELGRLDDLLQLWRREPASNAHRDALLSSRVVNEVIGAALSAGRGSDAEAVCRDLLNRNPGSEQWLTALARIQLDQGEIDEADELLTSHIAAATTPTKLTNLARIAQSLGRDDLSLQAAGRVAASGPQHQVAGLLIEADILSRQGKRDDVTATLARAAKAAQGDGKQIAAVADALEQNGARTTAIELLGSWSKSSSNEDILHRLAWLLEQENRLPEALAIWTDLYRQSTESSRKAAARQRMLDLASRAGSISDVAAEAEDRLLAGKGNNNDVSLLIDVYVGAQDPTSASEVLYSYRTLVGTEADMLRQLANLYLRCDRFGQADKVLWQLVDARPETAIDTLQELAVIALERKRPADAQRALTEIAKRTGETPAAAELRGGILDHLNRSAEAAREYRKAIAGSPNQTEDWLLWAASMSKANSKNQAIARLQVLVTQTDSDRKSDDLFTVAVDGLLNLEAPRPALRAARRQVILRTLANPRKLVFYQLIGDLSDTIGDRAAVVRAVEAGLPAGGEQRSEQLRELLTVANTVGQTDRAIEVGRTLISLGDYFPPEVFLQLGRQLVESGRVAEADAAFSRARESGDEDAIAPQVIALYERSGYFREALRSAHPLVARQPHDASLRLRLGGLLEQTGDIARAGDAYLKTVELVLLREQGEGTANPRQPAVARFVPATQPGGPLMAGGRAGQSVSESDQLLEPAIRGLLFCARTPDARKKLLDKLSRLAAAQVESARASQAKQPSGGLLLTANTLRRASFVLGEPETADVVDRLLIATWPNHAVLKETVVKSRVDWGLLDRAAAFAKLTGTPTPPAIRLREELAQLPTTSPVRQNLSPETAAAMLPRLIAAGRTEEARQVLAATVRTTPADLSQTLRILLIAAQALDDKTIAEDWARLWIEQANERDARTRGVEVQAALRAAWPQLSASTRSEMLGRLADAVLDDKDNSGPVAMQVLRLAAAERIALTNSAELATIAVSMRYTNASTIAEAISLAPADVRATVFQRAAERLEPARQRMVMLEVVSRLDIPLDEATRNAIVKAFESKPAPKADARMSPALLAPRWQSNSRQPELLRALAELFLNQAGNDAAQRIGAASALATIGETERADDIALSVIAQLRSRLPAPVPEPARPNALGSAVAPPEIRLFIESAALLSASARERLLAPNAPRPAADPAANPKAMQGWEALTDTILLASAGRRDEAFSLLRSAAQRLPDDVEIRRMLLEVVEADTRYADFVEVFGPSLSTPAGEAVPLRYIAPRIYAALHRADEIRQNTSAAAGFANSPSVQRLQAAFRAEDDAEMLVAFRSVLVEGRTNSGRLGRVTFSVGRTTLPALSGMSTLLDGASRTTVADTTYLPLASRDWAFEQFNALLNTLDITSTESSSLAEALLNAANTAEKQQVLIDRLTSRRETNGLTQVDRSLLLGLGKRAEIKLPDNLLAELNALSLPNDSQQTFAALASALTVRNLPTAQAASRWATLYSSADKGADGAAAGGTRIITPAGTPRIVASRDDAAADLKTITDLLAQNQPKQAEEAFTALHASGRFSLAAPANISLLWARLAAERGDDAQFKSRLSDLILSFIQQGSNQQPLDIREGLPAGKLSSEQVAAMAANVGSVIEQLGRHRPGATPLTRMLSVAGVWAAQNGNVDAAQRLLAQASALADRQGLGEHQLWVADLAERAGKPEIALSIQRRLLEARALPPDRVVLFLKHQSKFDVAVSARLAKETARYNADPAIKGFIISDN